MKFLILFFLLFSLVPLTAEAATADLSLSQGSISFSEETLITGDTVRIYAIVKNLGDVDVSGYVTFFQGSLPIGDSQIISSRVGSVPEEVYVDFVVPSGVFNIRAEIRGTDPVDGNSSNDSALTQLYDPILDDDRDGVENVSDNCPSQENFDQLDFDLDGLGDACDDDDDDDSLTDGVEQELETNPKKMDSDDDGLLDADDPHPTVPESQVIVPKPVVAAESPPSAFDEPVNTETESEVEVMEVEEIAEVVAEPEETILQISPKAVFTFHQTEWNAFFFKAHLPEADNYRVVWNFGDGATSAKEEVVHTYQKSGDYTVRISVEGSGGQIAEDSVIIHVPFFSLENKIIQFLLVILSLALLTAVFLFFRSGRGKPRQKAVSGTTKVFVRDED